MRDLAWTTPELLRSFQPGARLAVVLRDPAVRAASQYMNDCFAACQEPALAEEKLLGFEFCRCPVTPDSFAQIIDEALPVAEVRAGRGLVAYASSRSRGVLLLPEANLSMPSDRDAVVAGGYSCCAPPRR